MGGLILLLPRILSRSPSSLFPPFAYRTMNSVAKQKKALRSQMRSLLRRHYDSLLQHEDAMIQKNVLESEWYKRSNHICGYISCNLIWDVGTSKIIQDIFSTVRTDHQKFLYVPWIQDKQSRMKFFQIDSSEHLATNSFGILEPIPMKSDGSPRQDVMQSNKPIDLIFMPGLAYDRAGQRLGRGGGYYDCFLEDYLSHAAKKGWKSPLLVGLAYSLQILDEPVPTGARDMPIDALVFSSGVIQFSDHPLLRHE